MWSIRPGLEACVKQLKNVQVFLYQTTHFQDNFDSSIVSCHCVVNSVSVSVVLLVKVDVVS